MGTYLLVSVFTILFYLDCVMSQNIVGGWTSHDVEEQDLKDLSWRAVKGISQQSNDAYHMMPIKLISAKSQIVAGTKYELEILVGQSGCLKNVYVISVWSKPWENFEQFTIKERKAAS